MSAFLLIFGGAVVLISVYLLVAGIAQAPEGYEDETGFHFSPKSQIVRKHQRIRLNPTRLRASAGAVDLHQPAA